MKKQYRVVVTTGTKAENMALELEQRAGDLGRAVRIKAKTGAKYLLEEVGTDHRGSPVRIQVRRQGKDLEIRFEGGTEPDLIIENYYGEVHAGDKAILGQGGDGRYYEYLAETQNAVDTVPRLVDGHDVISLKLGAHEVAVTGSRWATLAFDPASLLGTAVGIGLASRIFVRSPANVSVQLDDITGDDYLTAAEIRSNITLTGRVGGDHSAGDIVTLTINGHVYKASVGADGRFSVLVAGSDLSADALKSIGLSFTASNSGGMTTVTSSHSYGLETGTQGLKTALTIESITNDNIIDQAEAGAAKTTVNGKVTGLYAAGDRVTVRLNNKTYMAQVDADGRFSVAVDTVDLLADADTQLEARITGTQGDTATASIDYGVSSVGAGPVLTLALDPITPDALINAQEGSGQVVVTGTVTGDFTAGDAVTLRVDGKSTTGAVDAHGRFAIPVDGSDLQGNQDRRVMASVKGVSGQTATAIAVYAVDVNPPSVTVSITGISSDSGVAGDFITNDSDGLTIRASLSAPLSAGEKLLYSSDNGVTWIDISTSAVNATTVHHVDGGLKNTSTVKFKVVDVAGNSGAVASQLVSIDTQAPSTTADVLAISDNVGLVQGTVATGTTTDDTALVVSGTLSAPLMPGEQVRIYDGTTYLGIATVASGATTWTFSDDRTLSHGQRVSYTARLIDWADNEGAGGVAYTATVDTSVPTGDSSANLSESDAIQTTGGVLTSPSPFQILNNVAGSHGYGKFSITREGVWSYTMDSAHDAFVAGQSYTDTVTVMTTAGAIKLISVTIAGTNDAPVITSGVQTAQIQEDRTLQVSGQILSDDVDAVTSVSYNGNATGTYGIFSVDASTGMWTYSFDNQAHQNLAANESLTDTFLVTVVDDQGATATQNVVITVKGSNDAPVIASETQTGGVKEDGTLQVSGQVSSSDVDHQATATYTGNATGIYGDFHVDPTTGVWTYTLANAVVQYLAANEARTEIFTVTVTDDQGATASQEVSVTITGTNDVPVVELADVTGGVTELVSASGNLTDMGTIAFSDVDVTDTHSVSVTASSAGALGTLTPTVSTDTVDGTGGQIDWTYSVAASAVEYLAKGQTKVERFTLTLGDGNGGTVDRIVEVTITGTNDKPVVALADVTGAVTELVSASGNLTDTGTIAFTDVDVRDTHTVSVTATSAGALGTLTPTVSTDTSNGTGGVISWSYSVPASAVEYLDAGETKAENFTITLSDGQGGTVNRVVSVTITGTNDAPMIAMSAGNAPVYTEQGNALVLDAGLTLSDVDNGAVVTGAQVSIAPSDWVAGDTLVFVDQGAITGSYNSATGVLTLSGQASLGEYEAALRSVAYRSTSDDPTAGGHGTRTISWQVNDGQSQNALSNVGQTVLSLVAVNDAPTLVARTLSPTFVEGVGTAQQGAAVSLFDTAQANVVESAQGVAQLKVQVSGVLDGAHEVLWVDGSAVALGVSGASVDSAAGLVSYSVSYDSASHVAQVTVQAKSNAGLSTAQLQTLVNALQYQNTQLDNPTPGARTVTLTQVKDTGGVANGGQDTTALNIASTVLVQALNDAPTTSALTTAVGYTEAAAATSVVPDIVLSDSDDTQVRSAQVRITDALSDGTDRLVFVDTASVSGSYNAATGVLTLTPLAGVTTLANMQAALRSVTYQSSSTDPTQNASAVTRDIAVTITDNGQGTGAGTLTSAVLHSTLTITPVNNAPVITFNGPAPDLTGGLPVVGNPDWVAGGFVNMDPVDGALSISDSDDSQLWSGSVRVYGWNWQRDALALDLGSTPQSTLLDARGASDAAAALAQINAILAGQVSYGGIVVNAASTGSDGSGSYLQLSFGGASSGVGLTGAVNVAQWQSLLRSVRVGSDDPLVERSIVMSVSDAASDFAAATASSATGANTRAISYQYSANNTPQISTIGNTGAWTEGAAAAVVGNNITALGDVDASDAALSVSGQDTVKGVSLVLGNALASDVIALSVPAGASLQAGTPVYDAAAKSWTIQLSGVDSLAHYLSAIRSLSYSNSSDDPTVGGTLNTRSVSVTLQDNFDRGSAQNSLSTSASFTINVTGVNDAPQVSAAQPTHTVLEQTALSLAGVFTLGDVDAGTGVMTATFTAANASQDRITVQVGSTGATLAAGGDGSGATATVTGTLAQLQALLAGNNGAAISYRNAVDHPASASSVSLLVNDGGATGTGGAKDSALVSVTVNITEVNDAPTGANTALAVDEDLVIGAGSSSAAYWGYADVDAKNLAHVIITSGPSHGKLWVDADGDNRITAGEVVLDASAIGTAAAVLTLTQAHQLKYQGDLNYNGADSYGYKLQDDGGVANGGQYTSAAYSAAITVRPVNDVPVVDTTDVLGAVTELVTPSGQITDSGTIAFSDVDVTDTHSVSVTASSAGALGTLTPIVSTDTVNGTGGQISWSYSVPASAVEYLGAGQTKVESFTITLSDGNAGLVNRVVTVTITGTNDVPVVASTDVTGAVTELVTATGQITDTGTIAFTDVDVRDTHSVSVTATSAGALGVDSF